MIKESFEKKIKSLQQEIVSGFREADADVSFMEDEWERPGGGGGVSNILTRGKYIEKGGVNISIVHGSLPPEMQARLNAVSADFYASGISLVIHPVNPFIPTVHFNIRYFELYEQHTCIDAWFGGGMDLTPYYAFPEDAVHFHRTLKETCDAFHPEYYPVYKKQCDEYFYNAHRQEHRGIGGIFFDYLKADETHTLSDRFAFTAAVGDAFSKAYFPIFRERMKHPYEEHHKYWQEIRRGRYVEFNLIHDRGTLFGLRTNGRTESILMSLPPTVRWEYNHLPEAGTPEAHLLETLKPKDWVNHQEF